MKIILISSLIVACSFSFGAEKNNSRKPTQKAYAYSDEKKMPLAQCLQNISKLAQGKKFALVMWQAADFYINDSSGEQVGNAYYSQDTCYIYLN